MHSEGVFLSQGVLRPRVSLNLYIFCFVLFTPSLLLTVACVVLCSINSIFHGYPNVLHYRNSVNSGIMAPGHTFTIEPMLCMGSSKSLIWPDKWTATTTDGLPSAQFEHTLLITEDGVEALTAKLPDSPKYFWEV